MTWDIHRTGYQIPAAAFVYMRAVFIETPAVMGRIQ